MDAKQAFSPPPALGPPKPFQGRAWHLISLVSRARDICMWFLWMEFLSRGLLPEQKLPDSRFKNQIQYNVSLSRERRMLKELLSRQSSGLIERASKAAWGIRSSSTCCIKEVNSTARRNSGNKIHNFAIITQIMKWVLTTCDELFWFPNCMWDAQNLTPNTVLLYLLLSVPDISGRRRIRMKPTRVSDSQSVTCLEDNFEGCWL